MKRRKLLEAVLEHWPAKVLSLAAAAVLFFFYRSNSLEERFISVPVKLTAHAGLAIANPYPRSVRVTVRGKSDLIFSILEEDITVAGDLSRFATEGEFRVPLRVARKGTAQNIEPLDVRVEPAEFRLLLEKEAVKSVEVIPIIKGQPAHGYELVQSSVTPSAVEVSGPRSVVQALARIDTEEVDVSGSTEDFILTVALLKDNPLLRYPREATVEFRGIVRAADLIKSFEQVDIIAIDLPPDLQPAQPLPKGSVRLQGGQLAIEGIDPSRLRLVVDCGELRRPGTVKLAPQPDIPSEFVVLKYEPLELSITFITKTKEGNPE